ncbi:unnamed protein product [Lota lota]
MVHACANVLVVRGMAPFAAALLAETAHRVLLVEVTSADWIKADGTATTRHDVSAIRRKPRHLNRAAVCIQAVKKH